MSSYASYDGIALIANHHILTDILRNEWGYEYWITSDAGATDRLCANFKMCETSPLDKDAIVMFVSIQTPLESQLTFIGSPSWQ